MAGHDNHRQYKFCELAENLRLSTSRICHDGTEISLLITIRCRVKPETVAIGHGVGAPRQRLPINWRYQVGCCLNAIFCPDSARKGEHECSIPIISYVHDVVRLAGRRINCKWQGHCRSEHGAAIVLYQDRIIKPTGSTAIPCKFNFYLGCASRGNRTVGPFLIWHADVI